MRARIWGSRGSLATPGPETVRYGGNTACIEIELSDGSLVILDAGTGIRGLGLSLDGRRVPVIGVTGPGFFGVEVGNRFDVAIPLCADNLKRRDSRTAGGLSEMGRLKPGWTAQRADT